MFNCESNEVCPVDQMYYDGDIEANEVEGLKETCDCAVCATKESE